MAKDSKGDESRDINIARGVLDETHFSEGACSSHDEPRDFKHKISAACERLTSCSWNGFRRVLWSLFPILDWLPKYKLKEDLLPDITGGITVGIMHIPQGLAFAMLATLPPVTGLYTALIPVLVYMLMGTSRHLSVGSFAVICLMVAQVCEREVGSQSEDSSPSPAPVNASFFSSAGNTSSSAGNSLWSPIDTIKMEVAVTLSFLIGIFQVVMGAARLGFLATFLSDPLISGFTTGSAVLVVISQLKHIFGLAIPKFTGPLTSVKVIIHMLKNIASSNVGAIIIGVLCLLVLIGLRYINDRYKSKMKFPIPGELLVVIVGTGISYGAAINAKYGVSIIGEIPKGLPPLSVPSMSVITRIIPDAFVIAVVIFATNISISKIFATKRGYKVDPNQELIAYGVGNAAGSFFSCFPICNALARTAVQENLANTQLCSVIVMLLILMVLLFIAPLFFHLPKPILAAVVIANLVGLLKQFSRLRVLWKIHKADAVVWFITCFGVILLGVDNGLGAGVICALFIVVLTLSRSTFSVLGQVGDTELYRDVKEYSLASEVPGVKILRFQSTLYFGNAEGFRNAFVVATGVDPSTSTKRTEVKNNGLRENSVLLEKESPRDDIPNYGAKPSENYTVHIGAPAKDIKPNVAIHTVVIDCSGFNFIDSVGLHTLPSIIHEFDKVGVRICLAGVSCEIRKRLESQAEGASKNIQPHMMFPSIHDAVLSAVRSHKQPDEEIEHNIDPEA